MCVYVLTCMFKHSHVTAHCRNINGQSGRQRTGSVGTSVVGRDLLSQDLQDCLGKGTSWGKALQELVAGDSFALGRVPCLRGKGHIFAISR